MFISYSRADAATADALRTALESYGVGVRLDRASIQAGDSWAELILTDLEAADAIVVLLSPESVKSEWVDREIVAAIAGGKRVIPVTLGVDTAQIPPLLSPLVAIEGTADLDAAAREVSDAIRSEATVRRDQSTAAASARFRTDRHSPPAMPASEATDLRATRGVRILVVAASVTTALVAVVTVLVQLLR